jgi:formylglycine-generating enzyme
MKNIRYTYESDGAEHEMEMIFVQGTNGTPYLFGAPGLPQEIQVDDFFIGKFPVTQGFYMHVLSPAANRSPVKGLNHPIQEVSWYDITKTGGFLDIINEQGVLQSIAGQLPPGKKFRFRLPSESEWEYAARGGPHWKDGFSHSGSNDVNQVAWYRDNSFDLMRAVGLKAPNQLGIHDMSGNQWEWCQDLFVRDTRLVPANGAPYEKSGTDRVLRGGCFHNFSLHCTVNKRYEIGPEFHDGCISFRLVLAAEK